MRPIIRRDERDDLEAARRLVSAAERQALERAEELRQKAEDLLHGATGVASAGAPSGDSADLAGRVDALRSEVRETAARLSAQAEELGRLRAEQHQLTKRMQRIQAAAEQPRADRSPAPVEADSSVLPALREAEDLLAAAVAAVERETERAGAVRAEAERARCAAEDEAGRIVAAARAEAEAIRRRARDEGRASYDEARRRFAEETAGLRVAMDQTWSTLEKLIGSPEHLQ